MLFTESNVKLLEQLHTKHHIITNGKGGLYHWEHETLPEPLYPDEVWAWVQKKPIDPKFWGLARWQLTKPRE
jgi:hypothetical protein